MREQVEVVRTRGVKRAASVGDSVKNMLFHMNKFCTTVDVDNHNKKLQELNDQEK